MPNIPNIIDNDNITLLIIAGSQATAISIYNQKKFHGCLVCVANKQKKTIT